MTLKAQYLEAMYENKLEFPGGREDAKQKTFRGGSMDIFWNYTMTRKNSSDTVWSHLCLVWDREAKIIFLILSK